VSGDGWPAPVRTHDDLTSVAYSPKQYEVAAVALAVSLTDEQLAGLDAGA
jgi:hypothetical protein